MLLLLLTKFKTMDYSLITNIEFADIDYYDYPDFCDAYIVRALYLSLIHISEPTRQALKLKC